MDKTRILMRAILSTLVILVAMIAASPALAQTAGPIKPPPDFKVKRLPSKPNPGAPPVPADEIIHRFAQNEDVIKKTYEAGSVDQTVKVEELADHGGQFTFTGLEYAKPDGQRYERVITPPNSTLHFTE